MDNMHAKLETFHEIVVHLAVPEFIQAKLMGQNLNHESLESAFYYDLILQLQKSLCAHPLRQD